MSDLHPSRLANVTHYRQAPGRHPNPRQIRPGQLLVELVTGGRGWVEHDGEWVEAGAGALLWHRPGDWTIGRSDFASPYRCLAVLFEFAPGQEVPAAPRLSQWPANAEVKQFTREVVGHYLDEQFDRAALSAYLYGRLLYQIRLHHRRAPASQMPPPLARVLETLETRYAEPLQLADLAAVGKCSIPHLHALFRRHLDGSPHQALNRRRLQAARELLATTSAPLKQVADQCGYANAAALCRAFRQGTGSTPAAFRHQRMQPWPADGA